MTVRSRATKILFFQLSFFPGIHGNAVQMLALCKRLEGEGFKTSVLTTRLRKEYSVRDRIEGIPVYRLPAYGPGKLRVVVFYLAFILYLLRKSRTYDILHLTTAGWINFIAPCLMRLMKKKSVYTTILSGYDDPGYFRSVRQGRLKVRLLAKADRIVAVSRALYDNCLEYGIPKEKVLCIPYGADTRLFHPAGDREEREKIRRDFRLPLDKKIVLFAGMIIHRKGADIAVEVWKKISAMRKDAVMVMAGAKSKDENTGIDEEFVSKLEQEIKRSGLERSVIMLGLVPGSEKMAKLFRASEVFFFPTRREGTPNTLLEAMASGLPSVISLLPGATDEVVVSGKSGYLVEVGDVDGCVRYINELLDDGKLREEMGKKARQAIEESFSEGSFVRKYVNVYRELTR